MIDKITWVTPTLSRTSVIEGRKRFLGVSKRITQEKKKDLAKRVAILWQRNKKCGWPIGWLVRQIARDEGISEGMARNLCQSGINSKLMEAKP